MLHAAEFRQERRAVDAVVGARSCHQNECLRKCAFKVVLPP